VAIDTSGQRWWEAEIHRLWGTLLLSSQNFTERRSLFRAGVKCCTPAASEIAGVARCREPCAACGRAGPAGEARNLLTPVLRLVHEGFDTADLKEAKALLDQLR